MFKVFKVLVLISLMIWPISLIAEFMGPTYLPAERLIQNSQAYLKENPNSHETIYALARIHYLAFINQSEMVGAYRDGVPPQIAEDWILGDYVSYVRSEQAQKLAYKELGVKSYKEISEVMYKEYATIYNARLKKLTDDKWEPAKISQEALLNHGKEALFHFNKAIKLDSKKGLYYLGLASFCHQYDKYRSTTNIKNEPAELKEISTNTALDYFYKAYLLSFEDEVKSKYQPKSGLNSLVSFEAGNAFLIISKSRKPISDEYSKKIENVTQGIAKLNSLPQGAITPIVFTLENHQTISDLLDPDLNVKFDLDGNGHVELWPWVKSTTGFLVWDPQSKGQITSGRQMFGSVTWWIFFRNGYFALDSLDDNRDGQLSGDELIGISTWFDKNSNGVSEPGEMMALNTLGVLSIGTKPSSETNGMPMHDLGLTLTNGKTLRTYDWITLPIKK